MRRSREIPSCVLLLAASAACLGCNEQRDCVDSQDHKQPDTYCTSGGHGGAHYLWGGRSGGRYGDTVVGGRSTSFSGIARGGFGSGAHGSGGE